MKLRASKILLIIFLINTPVVSSQNTLEVIINTPDEGFENETVEIYLKNSGFMGVVPIGEVYKFNLKNNNPTSIIIISMYHPLIEKDIDPKKDFKISILLPSRVQNLSEVIINARKKRVFELRRLKDFEGTYIFAGKKSEVINMNGVDFNNSPGAQLSASHTPEDLEFTSDAFNEAIKMLKNDGEL